MRFFYIIIFVVTLLLISFYIGGDTSNKDRIVKANKDITASKTAEDYETFDLIIDDQIYLVSFEDFPILAQYLSHFEKPKEKLRDIPFKKIAKDQYLASFACQEERCSHILLDFNQKTSFLLSDLSVLKQIYYSPTHITAAFLFERMSNGQATHQIKVMNLDKIQPYSLELAEETHLIPPPNQFQYRVNEVSFSGEKEITIKSETLDESHTMITTTWMFN